MSTPVTYAERLWDLGQQHLAAGRYVAARHDLESAEAILWRRREVASLARIYLPLLETRRQLRHLAVDGAIVISAQHDSADLPAACAAGVLLTSHIGCAQQAMIASRRLGRAYESLLLIAHRGELVMTWPRTPTAAAGLRVTVARSPQEFVDPDIRPDMTIPLPPAKTYMPGERSHAQARESLLVAWEALALKWQARHPAPANPWGELAHCRAALQIDPACEPITMRLIAIAEAIAKKSPIHLR